MSDNDSLNNNNVKEEAVDYYYSPEGYKLASQTIIDALLEINLNVSRLH